MSKAKSYSASIKAKTGRPTKVKGAKAPKVPKTPKMKKGKS